MGFPGQYYDQETGLHYNYFRYYNPGIGRYITPDPIGLEGGINPFVYVANNPVNRIDPEGLARLSGFDVRFKFFHFVTYGYERGRDAAWGGKGL